MKRVLFLALFASAALAIAACGSDEPAAAATSTTTPPTPTISPEDLRMLEPGDSPRAPVGALDTSKSYTATLKTEKGDIVVELLDDIAPLYVENFINLARIGYYDNTTFHRVLQDFMAQGGDPTGTGSGGPGYRFQDQFNPAMRHDGPGTLSMANAGLNTNGSQFFITFEPTPWLDPYNEDGTEKFCLSPQVSCHAVFGKVIEGMDVVLNLTLRNPQNRPTYEGDRLITVEITES